MGPNVSDWMYITPECSHLVHCKHRIIAVIMTCYIDLSSQYEDTNKDSKD